MRKVLTIVAALVVGAVASLMFATAVAAQNPVERTEGIAGAALESPPSRVGVQVWLEEPVPAQAERGFSFAAADPQAEDNDDRVTIALATFGVAAAAVVVGLLGYLLRVWLGLVKPPPPPEEPPGSH
jgi:hypothetical protein